MMSSGRIKTVASSGNLSRFILHLVAVVVLVPQQWWSITTRHNDDDNNNKSSIFVDASSDCNEAMSLTASEIVPDLKSPDHPNDPSIVVSTTSPLITMPPRCAFVDEFDGTWFVVQGNGNLFTASTCTPQTQNVFTIINVFEGGTCDGFDEDELQCAFTTSLSNRDCPYGNLASLLSWKTNPGETYYILISSATPAGTFGLQLWQLPSPDNDSCDTAISIDNAVGGRIDGVGLGPSSGALTIGSTVAAANDLDQDTCAVFSDSRGIWYKFATTVRSGRYMATTCTDATDYDSALAVFTASDEVNGDDDNACQSLSCVGVNDDGTPNGPDPLPDFVLSSCGSTSTVSWTTEDSVPGTTYYVLVQGFGAQSVGQSGLYVTEYSDDDIEPPTTINPPLNDVCQFANGPLLTASSLTQEVIVEGSVLGATLDGIAVSLCGSMFLEPAVWYYVEGTGYTMRVSTCTDRFSGDTIDTKLSVLVDDSGNFGASGGGTACNPSNFQCVGGNDNDSMCDGSARSSTFEFDSEVGSRYYILVHGPNQDDPDIGFGQFALSVRNIVPIENDDCTSAIVVIPTILGGDGSNAYDVVVGNIDYADVDLDTCQDGLQRRGVWYVVQGTGRLLTVSTCSEFTNFETDISVTIHNDADTTSCAANLNCAAFGQAIESGLCDVAGAKTASWMSVVGATYYVYVSGVGDASGQFGLLISEEDMATPKPVTPSPTTSMPSVPPSLKPTTRPPSQPTPAPSTSPPSTTPTSSSPPTKIPTPSPTTTGTQVADGSSCLLAIGPLSPDSVELTMGSTVDIENNAVTTDGPRVCGVLREAPGIFYYVEGTGTGLRASTCHEETDFDTAISVFVKDKDSDEDCTSSLMCMGGDDDDLKCSSSHTSSSIAFDTEIGKLYYILVHGAKQETGNFALSISSFNVTENNDCINAYRIPTDGTPVIASTDRATVDIVPTVFHCGAFIGTGSPGVWYKVVGTGVPLTATTCSEFTDFNTAISVFSGDTCGFDNLVCVGGNDDDHTNTCSVGYGRSTYTWPTKQGMRYYILIHGGYWADLGDIFAPSYGMFSLSVHAKI